MSFAAASNTTSAAATRTSRRRREPILQPAGPGFGRLASAPALRAAAVHRPARAIGVDVLRELPQPAVAQAHFFAGPGTGQLLTYVGIAVLACVGYGSVFMLTQAMLGFFPDAPRDKLYIDPWLPNWLPDITV